MNFSVKYHLVGMICGLLASICVFFIYSNEEDGRELTQRPEPSEYLTVEPGNVVNAARFAATRALHKDAETRWIFSLSEACDIAQGAIDLASEVSEPLQFGVLLADGNESRLTPNTVVVIDVSSSSIYLQDQGEAESAMSLDEICRETSASWQDSVLIMTASRVVLSALRQAGLQPSLLGIAN